MANPPTWHVLGNSASLLEEDGLNDLHPSIGVNRILRICEPDYVVIVDPEVFRREKERLRLYTGKFITYTGMERMVRREGFTPIVIKLSPHHQMRRWIGDYGRAGNTGVYAIEFAARKIHPQPGRILLHGMDFCHKTKGVTHFFGDGAKEKCSGKNWADVLKTLKNNVAFCNIGGILVENASPWHGPLDRFMRRADAGT